MASQYSGFSYFLTLATTITKAKEFKCMKQKLKVFCLRLRQFNVFDWTGLQNNCLTTVNTSQMMMIPIHRAIECFSFWEVPTSHQSFQLKSTKMSINRSQPHIGRSFNQGAMQLLAADLMSTIVQLIKYLLLFLCESFCFFVHPSVMISYSFQTREA